MPALIDERESVAKFTVRLALTELPYEAENHRPFTADAGAIIGKCVFTEAANPYWISLSSLEKPTSLPSRSCHGVSFLRGPPCFCGREDTMSVSVSAHSGLGPLRTCSVC